MASEIDVFSTYFVILQENEHGDPQLFWLDVKEQPFFSLITSFYNIVDIMYYI